MAPPAFSWVIDGALAACGAPGALAPFDVDSDLRSLAFEGTTLLVTLTRAPVDPSSLEQSGIRAEHFPIEEMGAPESPEQLLPLLEQMQTEINNGGCVTVHCLAGKGRSGTVIAAYLCMTRGIPAGQAIARVRAARPGSIESQAQEEFIARFVEVLDLPELQPEEERDEE